MVTKTGKLVGVCNGQMHCDLDECITDHDEKCEHMNNQTTTEGLREAIKKILIDTCGQTCSNGSERDYRAVDQLMQLLAQEKKAVAEEILVFLDELEMEQPDDLKTDNWRNWKYIRNSIVDKYNLAHSQEDRQDIGNTQATCLREDREGKDI